MATAMQLRLLLTSTLLALVRHEEQLRQLDAVLGDGDLGITVRSGSEAIVAALAEMDEDSTVDELLRVVGKAFATANPSTFAALIGGGLLSAAKIAPATQILDRASLANVAKAVAARIAERGKAQPGDKTILDALIPSIAVLLEHDNRSSAEIAAAMRDVAPKQVEETAHLQSARGRAAWIGERSVGHADPGATAYVLFLAELTIVLERQ